MRKEKRDRWLILEETERGIQQDERKRTVCGGLSDEKAEERRGAPRETDDKTIRRNPSQQTSSHLGHTSPLSHFKQGRNHPLIDFIGQRASFQPITALISVRFSPSLRPTTIRASFPLINRSSIVRISSTPSRLPSLSHSFNLPEHVGGLPLSSWRPDNSYRH